MAGERRDILWRFLGDTKGLDNASKDAQGTFSKIGDTAKKTGDILKAGFAVVAGAAIVKVGAALLDHANQLTAIERRTDTVFGGSADEVKDWADDVNEAFGLSESGVLNLASAFGDLLVPMGFTREAAAEMTTEALETANALSEWTGGQVTAEAAVDKLGAALTGERDGLKELGIVISEADIQTRLAEEGMSDLTGEALKQAEATATLALVQESSADAMAAYAAGGDEATRASKEAAANMAELKDQAAKQLGPALGEVAGFAADAALGLGQVLDVASKLPEPVKVAGIGIGTIVAGFVAAGPAGAAAAGGAAALTAILADLGDDAKMVTDAIDALNTEMDELGEISGETLVSAIENADGKLKVLNLTNEDLVRAFGLTSDQFNEWATQLQNDASASNYDKVAESLIGTMRELRDGTAKNTVEQQKSAEAIEAEFRERQTSNPEIENTVSLIGAEREARAALLEQIQTSLDPLTQLRTLNQKIAEHQAAINEMQINGKTSTKEYADEVVALVDAQFDLEAATIAYVNEHGPAYADKLIDIATEAGLAGDAMAKFVDEMLIAQGIKLPTVFTRPGLPPGVTQSQSGVASTGSGMYLVGETGPELVRPGSGSRVFNASETKGMLGGAGSGTVINVNVTAGLSAPLDVARAIVDALQHYDRTHGPLPVRVR